MVNHKDFNMRFIEFRVPSHHAGQTTDTAVFVNPEHVVHASVAREDPPAVTLLLAGGFETEVAGTPAEVMKALGGSVKPAKIAPPIVGLDGPGLDDVKDEHERVRDGGRERVAQGVLEEGRPDDDGEGRERKTFGTDVDLVEQEGERRKADREQADKVQADREKRMKAEADRQAKEAAKNANKR